MGHRDFRSESKLIAVFTIFYSSFMPMSLHSRCLFTNTHSDETKNFLKYLLATGPLEIFQQLSALDKAPSLHSPLSKSHFQIPPSLWDGVDGWWGGRQWGNPISDDFQGSSWWAQLLSWDRMWHICWSPAIWVTCPLNFWTLSSQTLSSNAAEGPTKKWLGPWRYETQLTYRLMIAWIL